MNKKEKKGKTHGSNRESPCHAARRHPIFARLGGESPLRVSVVITVKNDPEGERKLMEAVAEQTVRPDEVIIVEAGEYGRRFKESPCHAARRHLKPPIFARRILLAGCSRGKGRNIGVRRARNEVIAVTDAGCRPHKDWLEKLLEKVQEGTRKYKKVQKGNKSIKDSPRRSSGRILSIAIAGGYRVEARRPLQQIMARFLAPVEYFKDSPWHAPGRILFTKRLPRPTSPRLRGARNDGFVYLPASRSIMFTKKAWELAGGYPEEAASGGEDLEFARRLARHPEVKMIYCPQAVVDWEAPATLGEFFRDIVKHTRGNVEVRYRPHLWRNLTVVLRWMAIGIWPWLGIAYLGWIVGKGIKVIKIIKIINIAQIIIVQLAADAGVVWGLISSRKSRKLAKNANVDCKKVRPCRGKVGPFRRDIMGNYGL